LQSAPTWSGNTSTFQRNQHRNLRYVGVRTSPMIFPAAWPITSKASRRYLLSAKSPLGVHRTRIQILLSCHYPIPTASLTDGVTSIQRHLQFRSFSLLHSVPAPSPCLRMPQTRLHSTKKESSPSKQPPAENGHNHTNGHEHNEHDHDEHTHSHSIFGHSHSHAEEHTHDAEQIIAALKGSGMSYYHIHSTSS
jgi:hypothetical protein